MVFCSPRGVGPDIFGQAEPPSPAPGTPMHRRSPGGAEKPLFVRFTSAGALMRVAMSTRSPSPDEAGLTDSRPRSDGARCMPSWPPPRQCRCGVGWVDAPDRPRLPSATSGLPISGATTSKGFCSMATSGLTIRPPLSHGGGTGISVSNSAPCSAISWSTTPLCSESRCGAPGTRSAAETRSNRA